jgi:hypothetical protein
MGKIATVQEPGLDSADDSELHDMMHQPMDTVTLYRPDGPAELRLIEASGWREFPPRLPGQPIFYPVLNEEYATQIARDWNVKESGSGFVTRFAVTADVFAKYTVETVGGAIHKELWVAGRGVASVQPEHRRQDRGRRRIPVEGHLRESRATSRTGRRSQRKITW